MAHGAKFAINLGMIVMLQFSADRQDSQINFLKHTTVIVGGKDPSIWEGYTALERRSHSLLVVIMVWGFIDAVAMLLELSVMSMIVVKMEIYV
jgi:hypothetical protein